MNNKILWILQIVLAGYFMTGAIYMMSNYEALSTTWALSHLPTFVWLCIGGVQIALSIGLLIPQSRQIISRQVSISAISLIALTLLGSILYRAYAGTTGMHWSVLPALLLSFIVSGRWKQTKTR